MNGGGARCTTSAPEMRLSWWWPQAVRHSSVCIEFRRSRPRLAWSCVVVSGSGVHTTRTCACGLWLGMDSPFEFGAALFTCPAAGHMTVNLVGTTTRSACTRRCSAHLPEAFGRRDIGRSCCAISFHSGAAVATHGRMNVVALGSACLLEFVTLAGPCARLLVVLQQRTTICCRAQVSRPA